MLEKVVAEIIYLRPMIILTGLVMVILLGVVLFLCRDFSWQGRNIKLVGFFYELTMSETIILAVCLVKLLLVVSLLFCKGSIQPVYIVMYGTLVIVYNLCRRNLKEFFVSAFNGCVIMGLLYVANLLLGYLRDVLFDYRIAIALGLLALFLILYAAYDVAQCVLSMVSYRKRRS